MTQKSDGFRLVVHQEWIDEHNQLRSERIAPLEEYLSSANFIIPLSLQNYLMIHLMEECAELIQATAKGLRFGNAHIWPSKELSNACVMNDEFNDVARLAARLGIYPRATHDKTEKMQAAYELSRTLGRLVAALPPARKAHD